MEVKFTRRNQSLPLYLAFTVTVVWDDREPTTHNYDAKMASGQEALHCDVRMLIIRQNHNGWYRVKNIPFQQEIDQWGTAPNQWTLQKFLTAFSYGGESISEIHDIQVAYWDADGVRHEMDIEMFPNGGGDD